MAVPMRKKRAWSSRADDAASQETAAFEATVAAAKDTAAKSGAFLSTAKSDLTDHQRWLRAQSAAVERDRQRHDRWLQRQRDFRLAAARKERQRRRRRVMRQRAFQAMRHAVWAGALFVRSWFLFAVVKIWAGIASVGGLIASGASSAAHQIAEGTRYVAGAGGSALAFGSSLAASKAGAWSGSAGRSLRSGWTAAAAKSTALADTTGRAASRGLAAVRVRASALQAAAKRNLASAYQWTKSRTEGVTPTLYVGMAKLGRQAERYARAGAAHAGGIMARASAKATAPSAKAPQGPQAGTEVAAAEGRQPEEVYGPFHEGFLVEGVSPNQPHVPETAAGPGAYRGNWENALSSLSSWVHGSRARAATSAARTQELVASWVAQAKLWADQVQARARTRDVELSRMMIIAGALLLICGGLLLGGGLYLRSGAGVAATATADEGEGGAGIAWTFVETDKPLPERAVFTLSGTPASFRINGLSVGGVNLSDRDLTAVEGVLKPDVKRPDLKLALEVDPQTAPAGEGVHAVAPAGTIPAGAAFRLVFPFPPEAMGDEDGLTVEEYFDSYGGLLLKLRYEIDGTQKSLIQYLPPATLRAQLDEVSAGVDG